MRIAADKHFDTGGELRVLLLSGGWCLLFDVGSRSSILQFYGEVWHVLISTKRLMKKCPKRLVAAFTLASMLLEN